MKENRDQQSEELQPNTETVLFFEWPMITILTDADLSMLGEACHKTINGRGAVGQLIDKNKKLTP